MEIDSSASRIAEIVSGRTGPGLIFVGRKATAMDLAAELTQQLGWRVEWITADRPLRQRQAMAEEMRSGQLQLAVCTSTWSTGIDIPALRYVALTGRDKAPIGALQSIGRALRLHGSKEFEVINLVEPGLEGAAAARAEVMIDAGIEGDFLDELETQQQPDPFSWSEFFGGMNMAMWIGLTCVVGGLLKACEAAVK